MVRAVLLILGLSLLGATGLALAQDGVPLAPPAPGLPAAPPAPEQPPAPLHLPGEPAASEITLPGRPEKMAPAPPPAVAPEAPREREAAPGRPPAFRILLPTKPQEEPRPQPAPPVASADGTPTATAVAAIQTPALALDKTGPATVQAGVPFAYEISLRNVGTVPAQRVRVEEDLPPGTRVAAAVPAPAATGERLAWVVDSLPPGMEQRFRVEVVPATGGEWEAHTTVLVSATRTLHTHVTGAPAPVVGAAPPANGERVELVLSGPPGAIVGHPVLFDLRVTNRGTAPVAGGLIQVQLPPGLEHFYGRDIEMPLEPLKPGETRPLTLEVIAAQPGVQAGKVLVKTDGGQLAVARVAVAVTEDPVLALRLIGSREPWTDRENEYRIEVTNRGRGEARGVNLLNQLPQGAAIVSGVADGAYDAATRSVRWSVGTLAPGQKRELWFKLLSRTPGPALDEITARTEQGDESRLQTVLRFRVPKAGPLPGRLQGIGGN